MKRKLFSITAIIFISCAVASAQTNVNSREAASRSSSRTSADEIFDLNITERRITEHDFAASTVVEIGEETEHGLMLRVGVAVSAEEINLLLRNVRGQVRFRATLDRVLERLSARHAPGAAP